MKWIERLVECIVFVGIYALLMPPATLIRSNMFTHENKIKRMKKKGDKLAMCQASYVISGRIHDQGRVQAPDALIDEVSATFARLYGK